MPTTVVRARQKGVTGYVSVARPGKFGNPFKVGYDERRGYSMTLEEVLKAYAIWLPMFMHQDEAFRAAVLSLRGETIGCPCPGAGLGRKPNGEPRCHGHILADTIDGWEE